MIAGSVVLSFATSGTCEDVSVVPQPSEDGAGLKATVAQATTVPPGLLDFCQRTLGECQVPTVDASDRANAIGQARQAFWQDVFARPSRRATGPAAIHRPGRARGAVARIGSLDLGGLGMSDATRVLRGSPAWSRIVAVNGRLNREIRQTLDLRQYGTPDHWAIPASRYGTSPRGDCEDYVLAKRSRLIAEGIPASLLSIALAQTRYGEDHAVLLISTAEGDYVLDNLTDRIEHWTQSGLRWQSRQRPGDVLKWVDLRDM